MDPAEPTGHLESFEATDTPTHSDALADLADHTIPAYTSPATDPSLPNFHSALDDLAELESEVKPELHGPCLSQSSDLITASRPLHEEDAYHAVVYQHWPSSSYLHCLPRELRLVLARYCQLVHVSYFAGRSAVMALNPPLSGASSAQGCVTAWFGAPVVVANRLAVALRLRKIDTSAANYSVHVMEGFVMAEKRGEKLMVKWGNENFATTNSLDGLGKGCTMIHMDPVELKFERLWPERSEDAAVQITFEHPYLPPRLRITFGPGSGCTAQVASEDLS